MVVMAKRKRSPSPSEEGDAPASSKKPKAGNSTGNRSDQPTNKVLPVNITFPAKEEGCLRLATWNICGLNASQKKGFKYYVEAEDADILLLNETKVRIVMYIDW